MGPFLCPNGIDQQGLHLRYFYQSVLEGAEGGRRKSVTSFWLVVWACALSIGWLLPNHYPPWSSFHLDTWVAIVLCGIAAAVIIRSPGKVLVSPMGLVVTALLFVPWLQYAAGLLTFIGTAWIVTAYLLGFLLALMVGARWESATPGQLADGLFLAIGIASLFSIGLQLHQWLLLDRLDIWSMGEGFGRPFANFGQPNQLGTFLIWGLLATAWGVQRKYVGIGVTLLLSLYLLFGLALTGSRTAWIAVAIVMVAAWFWRRLWGSRWTPWIVTGLGVYFAVCVLTVGWLSQILLLGNGSIEVQDIARLAGETRPQVWRLFIDAALQRPWFGYGWDQVATAHLAAALGQPGLNILFSHSHNLFLDLMLWCGIPLGLLASTALVWWLWRSFRAVQRAEDALLLLLVVVVANHAMLELPLHYAYFLLPTGLVIGVLDVRLAALLLRVGGRWVIMVIWLASAALLSLIVRDYLCVEASYQTLRFEWANIRTTAPKQPPEVLLLTQLRELIRYARFEPRAGMSADELNWMRSVAGLYPNAGTIHKMAAALVWNQRPEEAQLWLRRMCKVVHPFQCEAIRRAWANQALNDPQIRAVPWPETEKREGN